MADAAFTAISLLWITQLIWIIQQPKTSMLISQALLLLVAFTIRYHAMYYPILAILAIAISKQKIWLKLAGIAIQICLVGLFVIYTSNENKKASGQMQFSAFGGWKLANNALYLGDYIDQADTLMSANLLPLQQMVKQYFLARHPPIDLLSHDDLNGGYYMFKRTSPLKQYMYLIYRHDYFSKDGYQYFAGVAPVLNEYGSYIIKKHPAAFVNHFVVPNLYRYLYPPAENYVLASMFDLDYFLTDFSTNWFYLSAFSTSPKSIRIKHQLLKLWPTIALIIHFVYLFSTVIFLLYRTKILANRNVLYPALLILCLWLMDAAFNCITSAPVLRYQLLVLIVAGTFTLIVVEYMLKNAPSNNTSVPNIATTVE
ncbi:hypothetical protein [Filimonas lacunae]|nr:hypothetical protein [Filimonas lacunae]